MSDDRVQSLPPPPEATQCSYEELICEDQPELHYNEEAKVCEEKPVAVVAYKAPEIVTPARVDPREEGKTLAVQARRFENQAAHAHNQARPLHEEQPPLFFEEDEAPPLFLADEEWDEEWGEEVVAQASLPLSIEHEENLLNEGPPFQEVAPVVLAAVFVFPLLIEEVPFFVFQNNAPPPFAANRFDRPEEIVELIAEGTPSSERTFARGLQDSNILGSFILYRSHEEGVAAENLPREKTPSNENENPTLFASASTSFDVSVSDGDNIDSEERGDASSNLVTAKQEWSLLTLSERVFATVHSSFQTDAVPQNPSYPSEAGALFLFPLASEHSMDCNPIVILHPSLLPLLREERNPVLVLTKQKTSTGILAQRVVRGSQADTENFSDSNRGGSNRQSEREETSSIV